jgi:hypothetical protein
MKKNSKPKYKGSANGTPYAAKLAREKLIKDIIEQKVHDTAVQIESDIVVQRSIWLMVCSIADAFGVGQERMQKFFEAYQANTEELMRMREEVDDDYAYEKLRLRAEAVTGSKIKYLYEHEAQEAMRRQEKGGS